MLESIKFLGHVEDNARSAVYRAHFDLMALQAIGAAKIGANNEGHHCTNCGGAFFISQLKLGASGFNRTPVQIVLDLLFRQAGTKLILYLPCLLYTSPSPRD